ncbi:Mycothiol acetyltransferase [subsurface metagenome]
MVAIKISRMRTKYLQGLYEFNKSLSTKTRRFVSPILGDEKYWKGILPALKRKVSMAIIASHFLRRILAKFTPALAFTAFVATDNGKVVGIVWLSYSSPRSGCIGIYIADAYQNKGIGTALLRRAIDAAREEEMDKVTLSVIADNPRAIRVYRKCGFHVVNRVLAMELDLHSPSEK